MEKSEGEARWTRYWSDKENERWRSGTHKKLTTCCNANQHCSRFSTILSSIVTPDSDRTVSFVIVDNYEQCWKQNIVQSCFTADSKSCCRVKSFCPGVYLTHAGVIKLSRASSFLFVTCLGIFASKIRLSYRCVYLIRITTSKVD